jgi:hypothetical protein
MVKQTFPKTFPPVRSLLLKRYGPLVGTSSFDRLKEIVEQNSAGMTEKERRVIRLRFFSELRGAEISSKLAMLPQNVFRKEYYGFNKVLTNFRSKKFYDMNREKILNMRLRELSEYLPYGSSLRAYGALKICLLKLGDMKVKNLVDMGYSVVGDGIIGLKSYNHLKDFLHEHDIVLPGSVPHFEANVRRYKEILNVGSINKVSKIVHKYSRFLEPAEFKVMRQRLKNHSLQDIGKEFDKTREWVRKVEGSALGKLRFYSAFYSKNYSLNDLMSMRISEFVNFIPPFQDNKKSRLKRVLLDSFSNRSLVDIVERPSELAKCPDINFKTYDAFRQVLKMYRISMPDLDYFESMKRFYRRNT